MSKAKRGKCCDPRFAFFWIAYLPRTVDSLRMPSSSGIASDHHHNSLRRHARRDAEAWRLFTQTTLLSPDVAQHAREVHEAERKFESLREELIARIRKKLGLV